MLDVITRVVDGLNVALASPSAAVAGPAIAPAVLSNELQFAESRSRMAIFRP
jgi:hypothetical protein